jgi:hypothetical protein
MAAICPWDDAYGALSQAQKVRHCEATNGYAVLGPPSVISAVAPSVQNSQSAFYCHYDAHSRPSDACLRRDLDVP